MLKFLFLSEKRRRRPEAAIFLHNHLIKNLERLQVGVGDRRDTMTHSPRNYFSKSFFRMNNKADIMKTFELL